MISAISIGNFKAFADLQRIPIRPLTLVYGANSSGKSSIIHSLILARHALEKGDLDVHRTEVGGEAVDLGGFRQYIYKREVGRVMEWGAELSTAGFSGRLAELLAAAKSVIASLEIGLPQEEIKEEQERLDPRTGERMLVKVPTGILVPAGDPGVFAYRLSADGAPLLQMTRRPANRLQLDRLEHQHPIFREVLKAIVETSTTAEALHPSDFEGLDAAIADLVPHMEASVERLLPMGLLKSEAITSGGQMDFFPVSRGRRREDLAAALRFFLPRTLDELIRGVGGALAADLSRLEYLGPLRSYPPRHLAFSQHHDPNWRAGGGYAWDVIRRDVNVRELVNKWLTAPERLQTRYELVLRDLVAIEELEQSLSKGVEDVEIEICGEPPSGDYDGDLWGVVKDSEAEAKRIQELIRSSNVEKLNDLIMVDRRSNTPVTHRDVGIGISQVLPVLVTAFAARNKIVAIEQPEIHLHPALQADLGDVFIQSALGDNRNRFLIETHSEHLLLRVMKRMRQTAAGDLPKGTPPVRSEDVAVLFVEADGPRSIVREMPLNEQGELVKAWPGGFFEEGLREIF